MQEIKNIIESLLFVAEEPLTVEKLRTILETAESKEIQAALGALSEEYDQRDGGFTLREIAGGWQIRSRPEYHEWIKRMLQPSPQRLSKAALETLAVIAYKQPIIRADIEHIRGVDCGGVLRQLMERKIIRVLGRKEIAGRPLIYATTKLFLEMFDLKDLNDLPTPKEIAELGNAMIDSQQAAATQANSIAMTSSTEEMTEDLEGDYPQEDDRQPPSESDTDHAPQSTTVDPISDLPLVYGEAQPQKSVLESEADEFEVIQPDGPAIAEAEVEDEQRIESDYRTDSYYEVRQQASEESSQAAEPGTEDDYGSEIPDDVSDTDDPSFDTRSNR